MQLETIKVKLKESQSLEKEELELFLKSLIISIKQAYPSKTYNNMCDKIQQEIANYLDELNVTYYASDTTDTIDSKVIGHSIVIADFTKNNQNLYLIDPTFLQFYCLSDKYKDLYIKDYKVTSKSPYEYAKKDINKTNKLLENGYIEFDNDTIKWYCDSFYKTKVGRKDELIDINIPASIYLKSLIKYSKNNIYKIEEKKNKHQ